MANFCGKCGKPINEAEQKNVFSMSGYGTVCAACYQRSAGGKGSVKGNAWTTYFKISLYLLWGVFSLGGLLVGASAGLGGAILFGALGFALGFTGIAGVMIFITMAEDIAVIRKNTVEINKKLQKQE